MRGKDSKFLQLHFFLRITPAYAGKRIDLNRVQDIQ